MTLISTILHGNQTQKTKHMLILNSANGGVKMTGCKPALLEAKDRGRQLIKKTILHILKMSWAHEPIPQTGDFYSVLHHNKGEKSEGQQSLKASGS